MAAPSRTLRKPTETTQTCSTACSSPWPTGSWWPRRLRGAGSRGRSGTHHRMRPSVAVSTARWRHWLVKAQGARWRRCVGDGRRWMASSTDRARVPGESITSNFLLRPHPPAVVCDVPSGRRVWRWHFVCSPENLFDATAWLVAARHTPLQPGGGAGEHRTRHAAATAVTAPGGRLYSRADE